MTTITLVPFRCRRTWLWLVLPLVVVISMGNRSPRPWGLNWMTALGGARVVVLGIDATGNNADLIVAARFRPGRVHLTHISRDTYVRAAGAEDHAHHPGEGGDQPAQHVGGADPAGFGEPQRDERHLARPGGVSRRPELLVCRARSAAG